MNVRADMKALLAKVQQGLPLSDEELSRVAEWYTALELGGLEGIVASLDGYVDIAVRRQLSPGEAARIGALLRLTCRLLPQVTAEDHSAVHFVAKFTRSIRPSPHFQHNLRATLPAIASMAVLFKCSQ